MKISSGIHLSVPAALAALTFLASGAVAQTPKPATPQNTTPPAAAPAPAPAAAAAMPVYMPVTVVDKKGDPVKNLTAADITLTDNGHIQTVTSFSAAQPAPMTFGILGQTSANLKTELGDLRLASVHFVDHTLPGTDDKVFVVQFAHEVDLLEDPTSNVNKLHDSLNQLGSPQFGNQNNGGDNSGDQSAGEHREGNYGGTLYDAIYLSSTEVLKKQPGHHVLIIAGDGVDRDSKETINDAIEAAQASNVAIFAIYFKGEEERTNTNPGSNRRGGMGGGGIPGGGGGYPGGGGGYPGGGGSGRRSGGQNPSEGPHIDGKEILEKLCSATGGYMVEGKKDKADEGYNKLAALLKNQYTLSYTPDKDASDSVSHHLTLTSKKNEVWALVQQDYTTAQ
ncbi:MAG TPA: VWA domain-containing protein [Acidobacteriaceae bacterium]|jgi:VWFA-related protein|nr:VWA domain-containing protein [Acidobacteriaceae bacterium]